jgi:glycosyltransferase involved in cell wall biosynthesis
MWLIGWENRAAASNENPVTQFCVAHLEKRERIRGQQARMSLLSRAGKLDQAGNYRTPYTRSELMLNDKRVAVVLPAYNAGKTLACTIAEIPRQIVDDIILTDDASRDNTLELAQQLGLYSIRHDKNRGYGGNQKTCYTAALARGAEIIVMLHPDYQYTPKLIAAMVSMIAFGEYDAVLASRILGRGAIKGGMPLYKYISNRVLTLTENILIHEKMSEYHSGYRAWSREVLERLPLLSCSDDFVFDNQMIVQAAYFGFRIGEISCPTKYFEDASSINFRRSVTYGLGVLRTALDFRFKLWGLANPPILADLPVNRLTKTSGAARDQLSKVS